MEEPFSDVTSRLKLETCEQDQLLPQSHLDQDDSLASSSAVLGVDELKLRLEEYTSVNAALVERLKASENENRKLRSQNEELVNQLQRYSAGEEEPNPISSEKAEQVIEWPQPPPSGNDFGEGDAVRNKESLDVGTATWLLSALEDAPLYMSYCDSELRYVWANRPQDFTNLDVIGKRIDDIYSLECEGPGEFIELKRRALLCGQTQEREITTDLPHTGRKTWNVKARPHFSDDAAVIGVSTTSADITEQVELKECLSKLRTEMAAREATENELRQAVQVTEEAIEAKNVFLAIMSHEIRTPLNGLLGLAEALDSLDLNGEQRELVSAILSSGVIIADILGDILDLASMEFGVLELEERPFDPSEVVRDIIKMAVAASRGKDVVVSSEFVNEIPSRVIGDAVRLRQSLKCLVLNAIKFTERGSVCIKLGIGDPSLVSRSDSKGLPSQSIAENAPPLIARSPRSLDGAGTRGGTGICPSVTDKRHLERTSGQRPVRAGNRSEAISDPKLSIDESSECLGSTQIMLYCEVVDTGVGIPEEAFPTLFEKFKQVSEGPTRSYGGTGLGLAICKRLVELMGGQLTVSSEVGKGSTFAFTVLCKTCENCKSDAGCSNSRSCEEPGIQAETGEMSPLSENEGQETSVTSGTSSTRPPKPTRPRILLAEDNKVNVMVAISMLKRLGFTAKVVANGVEALEAIRKEKYDLVLLDVCMPLMDGLQVAYAIRKFEQTGEWPERRELGNIFQSSVVEEVGKEEEGEEEKEEAAAEMGDESLERTDSLTTPRLPIVAVTANALRSDVDKCFAHGMDAFIAKPVMFQKLQEILYKYLPTAATTAGGDDGSAQSPPAPAPPSPPT